MVLVQLWQFLLTTTEIMNLQKSFNLPIKTVVHNKARILKPEEQKLVIELLKHFDIDPSSLEDKNYTDLLKQKIQNLGKKGKYSFILYVCFNDESLCF